MAGEGKTFMDDRESLEALIDCLPATVRQEYLGYQHRGLESAFPGRRFVVYTLQGGAPKDIEMITLGALRMSAEGGPTVESSSDRHRGVFTFGMVPQRLPEREVFLHVPQKFELKWKGKRATQPDRPGVNFAPHYAVLIKTRSRPDMKVDGHTYCVRMNLFSEMYPELQVGY